MAIKKTNERITLTFTKEQIKWLRSSSKKLDISVSRFIKWLIDKNCAKLLNQTLNRKELDELIKIARTPWINFNEEND